MRDDLITFLKLEDLTETADPPLRNKEYFVLDANSKNLRIQPNKLYRAGYFGLMIMEEGSSYYSLGDHEYQITKGDILFCVPQEVFKLIYVSPDVRAKQIFFSVEMISDAGFNYRSNDILKSFSSNPSHIIRHEGDLFRRLSFHMDELATLNKKTTENYYGNDMMWHHFSLLMYDVENYIRGSEETVINTSREEELTTTFFGLVREHYIAHHDVQFYADELYVSRKYLSRIVKKTMCKSPKDIINQVLLIEAKILLRNSTSNVSEVAHSLNFSDTAVFSKFFKKLTGRKPSEYKMDDLF